MSEKPLPKTKEYKQRYRKAWEKDDRFRGWLQPVYEDSEKARCVVCNTVMQAHMKTLIGHNIGKKHKNNLVSSGTSRQTSIHQSMKPIAADGLSVKSKSPSSMSGEYPPKTKEYMQRYRTDWEKEDRFREWLQPVDGDLEKARCSVCNTVMQAHLTTIAAHGLGKKHKDNLISSSNMSEKSAPKAKDYPQRYRSTWEKDERFRDWLQPVEGNWEKARCVVCNTVIKAYLSTLVAHSNGKKHKDNLIRQTSIIHPMLPIPAEDKSSLSNLKEESTPKVKDYTQRYRSAWENEERFREWLQPVHGDSKKARCIVCSRVMQAHMKSLIGHVNSKKHNDNLINRGTSSQSSISQSLPPISVDDEVIAEFLSFSESPLPQQQQQQRAGTLQHFPHRKFVLHLADDMNIPPSKEMIELSLNTNTEPNSANNVRELENLAAQLLGKEAAMFVLTGTMANTLAVMAHCPTSGGVILAGDRSHLYRCCQATLGRLNNINMRVMRNEADGRVNLDEVRALLTDQQPEPGEGDEQWAGHQQQLFRPRLLCIENAHTFMGGEVLPMHYTQEVNKICEEFGLKLHIDGARLLHAAYACNMSPALLAAAADSVTLCLNKGLDCQNGSIIAGTKNFIETCRHLSGVFCTGSVKTEVLAASCCRALAHYVQHVARAHLVARNIVKGLRPINSSAVTLVTESIPTNIILLECDCVRVTPQQLVMRLRQVPESEAQELGDHVSVTAKVWSHNTVRLVTHSGLSPEHEAAAIRKIKYVIEDYDKCIVVEYSIME